MVRIADPELPCSGFCIPVAFTPPFKPAWGVQHGAKVAFGLAFIGRHQIDPLRQRNGTRAVPSS